MAEPIGPEVTVRGLNDLGIQDGDNKVSAADGTNFDRIPEDGIPVIREFSVTNDGDRTLILGTLTLPTGFTVMKELSETLAPGETDTFAVRLDNDIIGTKSGQLMFTTNNPDETFYNFRIQGKVIDVDGPEVTVRGLNDVEITDGDNKASAADGTNFGTIPQTGTPVVRTFTVINDGDFALIPTMLTLPEGFTLTEELSDRIKAGDSDTLTVQLDSDVVGTKTGQLTFITNDADEPLFNFRILGKVL